MKKTSKILGLLAAFVAQVLWATPVYTDTFIDNCNGFGGCDPCFGNSCPSFGVGVAADFLWWKPCIDNLDYAIKFSQPPPTPIAPADDGDGEGFLSDFKSIHLGWEPGVRVMAWVSNRKCNWGVGGSWTHVNIRDTASIRITEDQFNNGISILNPFLITQQDGIAAKASFDACYHDWDVLASHSCFYKNCHCISSYVGVAGMMFNQEMKEKLRIFDPFENSPNESEGEVGLAQDESDDIFPTKWKADYRGVGFRVGFHYEFGFSRCFKFFARADGSLLTGKVHENKLSTLTEQGGDLVEGTYKDPKNRCHFVPGYHIAAGFSSDLCLCNIDILFRLGYEFVNWHNLPSPRILSGQPVIAFPLPTNLRTVSFHGLFAGIGVSF